MALLADDRDLPRVSRSRLPLPIGTLIGFNVAVLAVLLIAFVSQRSLQSRTTSAELVTHTFEVLDRLDGLLSSVKDAETGQRGFLLTGDESYLEPYVAARAALGSELQGLRALSANNPVQQRRLQTLEQLTNEKMQELEQTVALRRAGDSDVALAVVRGGRGKIAMDRIRGLVGEMRREETGLLAARQAEWERASNFSFVVTWGGAAVLLCLILAAAVTTSREFKARETEAWLRGGQLGLNLRLEGGQRLETLGEAVLGFLAEYLGAQVGAAYVTEDGIGFRRVAGYALPPGEVPLVRPGDGLLGQAVRAGHAVHITDVPENYLPIVSATGRGQPRELLVAPAIVDRTSQGIIELGFFRAVDADARELLTRASESLAVALRSAKDRTRLEELLEETQRQAEELQTQQEELRVTNEELEEQSRALKESQTRLEAQQAELEASNVQLEEQTQELESQKDGLSRVQAALIDKATELERSNQYKSEFLANMSHELRTPLNSSLILAKLLADNRTGSLTDEQVRYAQTISSAGNDLLALINDILDLSKIEAGKMEVEPQSLPVAAAVDTVVKTLQPLAQQKRLTFTTAIEPGTPAHIETDPQRVGQILLNLGSNAIKFTDSGEVSLRVSAGAADTIHFALRDTGVGIPADQQAIIFDAFRQADGSTHRKHGGTGLGLSIARDLARLLGGDIAVESAPDKGSTFTLTLPLTYRGPAARPAPASPAAAERHAAARPAAPPERPARVRPTPPAVEDDRAQLTPQSRVILIIEDDVHFAEILRDLAHELGFECIVTHTAGDALAAAETYKPKGILLDVNLPDHSGLGVLDHLKHNPQTRHVPVHMISALDQEREAYQLGAIGYARKPVEREQLVAAFGRLEAKLEQQVQRVLVVEDDERQRSSIGELLAGDDIEIVGVATADEALRRLESATFDCMVVDLNLPGVSGYELLERMAEQEAVAFPPVIIYTGKVLNAEQEHRLRRYARSIIIKDARSPERLLDEVTLFLHQVEAKLPLERQRMLRAARDRESALEGRRILVVEDDVRNIFALSSLLEPKGVKIEIARNGREALDALARGQAQPQGPADLVLMDIMMPEMDGLTAMREIRKRPEWKKLPIIALTAKAMRDDHDRCLAAGANDYIAKPLDVEKLLSLVRIWMPKH